MGNALRGHFGLSNLFGFNFGGSHEPTDSGFSYLVYKGP